MRHRAVRVPQGQRARPRSASSGSSAQLGAHAQERAAAAGGSALNAELLTVQRLAGNAAVGQLLHDQPRPPRPVVQADRTLTEAAGRIAGRRQGPAGSPARGVREGEVTFAVHSGNKTVLETVTGGGAKIQENRLMGGTGLQPIGIDVNNLPEGTTFHPVKGLRFKDEDAKKRFQQWAKENASSDRAQQQQIQSNFAAAQAVGDTLGALLLTAKAIYDLKHAGTDPDKAFTAGVSLAEGAVKTVTTAPAAFHGIAKAAGKAKGIGHSEGVSEFSGTVGEAFGGLKSLVVMVKKIIDVFRKWNSTGKREKARLWLEALVELLKAGKSAVKTATMILQSSACQALKAAVPGLGIAISAANLGVKTYESIFNLVHRHRMRQQKREIKRDHAHWFVGAARTRKILGRTYRHEPGKKEVLAYQQSLPTKLGEARRQRDDRRIAELQQDTGDIEEYLLAKELQTINEKRLRRAAIEAVGDFANIAGEVLDLTGVGAVAGVPVKAAAAGWGAGFTVARTIKQFGRDRAAKEGAWDITKRIFNAKKSSAAKEQMRGRHAEKIFSMIAAALQNNAISPEDEKRIKRYVQATGASYTAFVYEPDLAKKKKMLTDAMKARG